MISVTLQYFDGCPNWQETDRRLRALADEYGFTVQHQRVETHVEAVDLGFRGSPTVLVDGVDPFAEGDEPIGLACRVYITPAGLQGAPTWEQLRSAMT